MTTLYNAELGKQRFHLRLLAAGVLVLLCFGLLAYRWVVLQVLRHDTYAAQAENNRTAMLPVPPGRGRILDRNGQVLANNYSAYTLELTPSKTPDLAATIDALARIIPISEADRRHFKRLRQDTRGFEPVPLRTRLSEDEVARVSVQRYRFPGADINARLFRAYPQGQTASHLIGYIGRINRQEKDELQDSEDADNYAGTDHIGKLGVEQYYEAQLHGHTGYEQMETTAGGFVVRRLGSQAATPGQDVVLSIDTGLQRLAEEQFGARRGALVAIDPRNGQVLALVSAPTFDPNLFVEGIDQENWDALNTSLDKPLLNRALRGTYPPGSTYKPFMALAALQTGARSPRTYINDGGSWTFGGHTFRSGHALGAVDMYRSIVKSSNVYYYTLANDMGVDAIHRFMAPLGFGQITGIDLPGEVRGVLPSTQWKRDNYKTPVQQKWYAGETISLGIGQGYNNFTMLQMAHALSTVVGGGISHAPRVAMHLHDPVSGRDTPAPAPQPVDLGYKPEHIALVMRAMAGVTREGTSRGVFAGAPYASGGKTGTAQAISIGQKSRYNAAALAERKRDHSLYIAFAPAERPVIALAVIVENAGFGATAAAPIARRVLDYWLLERSSAAVPNPPPTTPQGTAPADAAAVPPAAPQPAWKPAPALQQLYGLFAGTAKAGEAQAATKAVTPPQPGP